MKKKESLSCVLVGRARGGEKMPFNSWNWYRAVGTGNDHKCWIGDNPQVQIYLYDILTWETLVCVQIEDGRDGGNVGFDDENRGQYEVEITWIIRDDKCGPDKGWVPTYDDEDKAELLPGGGGDVDHGEDQVEEGEGGEEETLEEDREGAGETQSSGVYYYYFPFSLNGF